ncbi:MAG: hypothetical protein Q8M16_02050 [Pirellulaceae bacterium]|nr:hypothetical protein [Pirellulaceae bacterium]
MKLSREQPISAGFIRQIMARSWLALAFLNVELQFKETTAFGWLGQPGTRLNRVSVGSSIAKRRMIRLL